MSEIDTLLKKFSETWPKSETWDACRYVLLGEGKRIRPTLAIEAFKAVGGEGDEILPYACALEMFHASSLIVDDIMDNDDYRRGLPACHKKFSLGAAVLASHMLSVEAMAIMANNPECLVEIAKTTKLMCVGQDEERDEYKTGALICSSMMVGAIIGHATKEQKNALETYGKHIGLLFQLRDDILDGEREEQPLILDTACLDIFGPKADKLKQIGQFIVMRTK